MDRNALAQFAQETLNDPFLSVDERNKVLDLLRIFRSGSDHTLIQQANLVTGEITGIHEWSSNSAPYRFARLIQATNNDELVKVSNSRKKYRKIT